MRKLAFCICENKDADQLRSNCAADQRLCFRYRDSTIPLLSKSEIQASNRLLWLYSPVCVGPGRKPRRPVFSQRGSNDQVHLKGTQYLFAIVEADVKPYGGHNSISVNHTRYIYSLQYIFLFTLL